MTNKDITIDSKDLKNRYKYTKCSKCQGSFVYGDKIHTHTTQKYFMIYHKECWESLYH